MNPKSLYRAALLECLSYVCSDEAYAAYRKLAKKGCPDGWFGLGSTAKAPSQTSPKLKNITAVPPNSVTQKQRNPSAACTNLQKSPTTAAPANGIHVPLSNTVLQTPI